MHKHANPILLQYAEIWNLESTTKVVVMEELWRCVLMTNGMKQELQK